MIIINFLIKRNSQLQIHELFTHPEASLSWTTSGCTFDFFELLQRNLIHLVVTIAQTDH